MWWTFDSDHINVQEEELIYGPKDLLSWIGGALGIFVGYSIFDLTSLILDWIFQFVCRIIWSNWKSLDLLWLYQKKSQNKIVVAIAICWLMWDGCLTFNICLMFAIWYLLLDVWCLMFGVRFLPFSVCHLIFAVSCLPFHGWHFMVNSTTWVVIVCKSKV